MRASTVQRTEVEFGREFLPNCLATHRPKAKGILGMPLKGECQLSGSLGLIAAIIGAPPILSHTFSAQLK